MGNFLGVLAGARGKMRNEDRAQRFQDVLMQQKEQDRGLDEEFRRSQIDENTARAESLRMPQADKSPLKWEIVSREDGTYLVNPVTGEEKKTTVPGTPRAPVRDPVADHAANRRFDINNPLPQQGTGGPANPQATDRLGRRFDSDKTVQDANLIANSAGALRESASISGAPADLAFIFGFMKILDPSSTVREGEFAQIEKSRSAPSWLKGMARKAEKGQRLSIAEKQKYMEAVGGIVNSRRASVAPIQKRYGALARQAGADSSLVAPDPFQGLDSKAQPASSGDIDLRAPTILPADLERAKRDPEFAAYLRSRVKK